MTLNGHATAACVIDRDAFSAALPVTPRSELRCAVEAAWFSPEPVCVPPLLEAARLPHDLRSPVEKMARELVSGLRATRVRSSGVDALMQEFTLSSREGVALMCLAEALLRVPDPATADRLIRDKLAKGDWQAHLGHSPSLFVNAATWGLLITGRLVSMVASDGLEAALTRLLKRGGEPLIRKGMDLAMRMLGDQFVLGRDIEEALQRAQVREAQGYRHSYDMLGEAAMTALDADRYFSQYAHAVEAIGQSASKRGVVDGPGISVKLSALHPRYSWAQRERVLTELLPRLQALCVRAKFYDIGLNIDAEESDRLDLSLDLLEALAHDSALSGWRGLGFVVQAYQKRAPVVLDFVIDLARRTGRRLMVRLVKGAYWDTEIKRAQMDGLQGYPVFTRKVYTDVSYLACARKLLAGRDVIYPQFATHNAHTLAAVFHLASAGGRSWRQGDHEFQCLHGMGEALYDQILGQEGLRRQVRIYAPVGSHDTLLAYLVRRLLENGANTSFVNRIVDEHVSLEDLIADPVAHAERFEGTPHPEIHLPVEMWGSERVNASGHNLASEAVRRRMMTALAISRDTPVHAAPIISGEWVSGSKRAVRNPANWNEVLGHVTDAQPMDLERALKSAGEAMPDWAATPGKVRSDVLLRAADLLERDTDQILPLLVREAGKSWANALGELREAVDLLRYYASQCRDFNPLSHVPLGPVLCISPWNFPLAIFTGQVAAALAAGNTVLAKPAEQTPLVAAWVTRLLHEAGVPVSALHLLPGDGETVGGSLVRDPRIRAVMFTGSTEVAKLIQRALAERGGPVPLIAETGGQNAMIVDATALPEQVVSDVLASAFDSAGQRCSALRVLCLQEEIADRVLTMLRGALAELTVGNPVDVRVDVGPVIDAAAHDKLEGYIASKQGQGAVITRLTLPEACASGTYVAPTLIEAGSWLELNDEQFGPVLHVLRYRLDELEGLIDQIHASGYGLTMGLHTRIDETIQWFAQRVKVGNLYVNRNMVGAVVGAQPFGGEGLSGTGPKAGGPLYLHRLLSRSPGPACDQGALSVTLSDEAHRVDVLWSDFLHWLNDAASRLLPDPEMHALRDKVEVYRTRRLTGLCLQLPGPTGEVNSLRFTARSVVASVAEDKAAIVHQIMAAMSSGNRLLLADSEATRSVMSSWPDALNEDVRLDAAWFDKPVSALLFDGSDDEADAWRVRIASRSGPIIPLLRPDPHYDTTQLIHERTLCVNTAASGGNVSLMTLEG